MKHFSSHMSWKKPQIKPDNPPFFSGDFFPAIRRIQASPLNIANIKLKDVYRFLLEETAMSVDAAGTQQLLPLRVELWDVSW